MNQTTLSSKIKEMLRNNRNFHSTMDFTVPKKDLLDDLKVRMKFFGKDYIVYREIFEKSYKITISRR